MKTGRSLTGALVSTLALTGLIGLAATVFASGGDAQRDLALAALVNAVLVLSLQIFIGNTGVLSFGHCAFPALAAYGSAILTAPVVFKQATLSSAPFGLAGVHLGTWAALLIGVALSTVLGAGFGLAIARSNGLAGGILTFVMLVVVHEALVNWDALTG